MLAQDSSVEAEFKTQAKGEQSACSEPYYHCYSYINDLLKVGHIEASKAPACQSTARYAHLNPSPFSNTSDSCIKLLPCDTWIFKCFYIGPRFITCSQLSI